MMGPTLLQPLGGGSDPALAGRIADAEAEIASLKQGKATTGSVTAVSNRVATLEAIPSGQVTIRVPEDGTLAEAIVKAKVSARYGGPAPIVDIAPGYYPGAIGWLDAPMRLRARGVRQQVVTAGVSNVVASATSRDQRCTYTVPNSFAAACQVGDLLHLRRTTAPTDAQAATSGAIQVLSKTLNSVTVRFRAYGQAIVPVAGDILYRSPVQIRAPAQPLFAPIVGIAATVELDGIAVATDVDPTTDGSAILIEVRKTGTLILPAFDPTAPYPSLVLGNASYGMFVHRGGRVLDGYLSVGACVDPVGGVGVELATGAELHVAALHIVGCNVNLRTTGDCDVTTRSYGSTFDTVIACPRYEGVQSNGVSRFQFWNAHIVSGYPTIFLNKGSDCDVTAAVVRGDVFPPPNAYNQNLNSFVAQ